MIVIMMAVIVIVSVAIAAGVRTCLSIAGVWGFA